MYLNTEVKCDIFTFIYFRLKCKWTFNTDGIKQQRFGEIRQQIIHYSLFGHLYVTDKLSIIFFINTIYEILTYYINVISVIIANIICLNTFQEKDNHHEDQALCPVIFIVKFLYTYIFRYVQRSKNICVK